MVKKKTNKKKIDPFKNMGTGKDKKKKVVKKRENKTITKNYNSSFLTTLELADVLRAENTKIEKKNIFKRFKDWLGNAWFVFFNSYGG